MAQTTVRESAVASDMALHLHPQTNPDLSSTSESLVLTRGEGPYVYDDKGKKYIEAMASLWCASLGFNPPRLVEAATKQLNNLSTYHCFGLKTNEAIAEVVRELALISPIPDAHFFFTNSGSESNDTMIKIVWHYHSSIGKPNKRRIISRNGAYHGSTVMGATLSGLPHMHHLFNLNTQDVLYTTKPHYYREGKEGETEEQFSDRLARELEELIVREGPDTIGAMIAEPVMGAGGVMSPPVGYFDKIHPILKKYDILLCSDEVICGFGRTGNYFGCQTYGYTPDLISTAKAISAGILPFGSVFVGKKVYDGICKGSNEVGLFGHGYTYSGHPVTAAVAAETLKIYRDMDLVSVSRRLGDRLFAGLHAKIQPHPLVGEVRGKGFVAGIELVADKTTKRSFDPSLGLGKRVDALCLERGLIVRPLKDNIAICPTFVLDVEQVDEIVDILLDALNVAYNELPEDIKPHYKDDIL